MAMIPRPASRGRALSFFFLLASLPAAAQQAVLEPMRLPASALAAPMVGTHLGALAQPTLRLSLTPSLQTPTLTPTLVPQVRVSPLIGSPVVAPSPAPSLIVTGMSIKQAFAERKDQTLAVSAFTAGLQVRQSLSQRNAQTSQVLSSFYEGRLPAAPAVDLSPVEAPSASGSGDLAQTQGLSGQQLLGSLHQITGRGYHANDYRDASQYMFGTADNITSHGIRGVIDAYSGIFVPGSSHNGGDYSEGGDQDGDGFPERDGMNVEHTWPQSFFGKSLPMRSDLHHLLPTFQHPNSMRSNLPFGEVNGRPDYSNNAGAKEGGGVFEPPDVSKGRVARAVLYFYTRYYDRDITQGAYNHGFFKDRIDMFLHWNREHPPTADELRRNDFIEKFQGNRNPYVDDPSLADRVGAEGFSGIFPVRDSHHDSRRLAVPARLSPLDFTQH